ncbi:MAG: NAD(P)/FAD-dependent oxidoreductase, partial [Candidatus Helarchaeota archaeon]
GIAYQEYWTGKIDLDPRYFYAFMDRELSAGYAFCNMKEDLIIIGVGAEKGKDIKGYQEKFIKYLKQGFGLELGQMIRREACITTNIFTTEPQFQYLLGKNNVLLVGEAADLFNIMGEGIPSAIKSGINAAESIIEHIEGDQTRNVVEIYEKKNEKLLKKLKNNWIGFRKQFDAFTQF